MFRKHFVNRAGLLSLALLALLGWLFWTYGSLQIQVMFASEQTRIFEEMRLKALQSGATEAGGFLKYIVNYYPSGTKQAIGSRLDQIVERDRKQAVDEIINHLRKETGEDLGTNPEIWIEKYAPKQ